MPLPDDLLQRLGITPNPPATDAEIAGAEAQTGLTFPDSLRDLYRQANGVVIHDYSLTILPLDRAVAEWRALGEAGYPQAWGYFPFTDSNDSNPFCVCCRSPLTGYVVWVPHDDDPAPTHRDLSGFFAALAAFLAPFPTPDNLAENRLYIEDLPSDFSGSERTARDREVGRLLLEIGYAYGEPEMRTLARIERSNAFAFSFTLLGAEDVAQIAALLSASDEYISQSAADRLKEIGTPNAQAALATHQSNLLSFVRGLRARVSADGIAVKLEAPHDPLALTLSAGGKPIHLNPVAWYAIGQTAEFEAWYQKQVARYRAT